ncbi:8041_t:CDS:2 [Paraglomus occultum]|uniref:8041_t:CDS:1 n=1 Tax=Paraglomus occultum TaxID=144539 RepID=A0A9N8VNB4_9GLOM|nr:8041_t:CDS:2 [Paraglomus occultum]
MRLFCIPLFSHKTAFYCQHISTRQSYLAKITAYTAKKWDSLKDVKKSRWKVRLYVVGQQLLDKTDHQESFLKSVPIMERKVELRSNELVPFIYPSTVISANKATMSLDQLITDRLPYHRKYMIYSALWVPLACTFTIVPIIPNIPLFYNLFRLYSHYKAYKGAQHLRYILDTSRLSPTDSDVFNKIYSSTNIKTQILDDNLIDSIAKAIDIPGLAIEIKRARQQILEKIKKENEKTITSEQVNKHRIHVKAAETDIKKE